jgi:hypothetical protein
VPRKPSGREGGPGGAGRACSCPVRVMFEPTVRPPRQDEVESSVSRVTDPSARTGLTHRTCEAKSLRPGLHRWLASCRWCLLVSGLNLGGSRPFQGGLADGYRGASRMFPYTFS